MLQKKKKKTHLWLRCSETQTHPAAPTTLHTHTRSIYSLSPLSLSMHNRERAAPIERTSRSGGISSPDLSQCSSSQCSGITRSRVLIYIYTNRPTNQPLTPPDRHPPVACTHALARACVCVNKILPSVCARRRSREVRGSAGLVVLRCARCRR